MVDSFWGTTNIKVAAAVAAFGAKLRESDPVTCIVEEGGHRKLRFGSTRAAIRMQKPKWNAPGQI
jgi:hypothetical protein